MLGQNAKGLTIRTENRIKDLNKWLTMGTPHSNFSFRIPPLPKVNEEGAF